MRRGIVALCVWALASAAWAQATPSATNASPGLALIESAGAQGVFELMPSEGDIVVRHARSGLTCTLPQTNANRLVIFPQAARGEDVACDSNDGAQQLTLYATRYTFRTTLREQIDGSAQALRQRFPNARALPAPAGAGATTPRSQSVRFAVTNQGGEQMYWRVSVAMVDGWVIKMRYNVVARDNAAMQTAERAADAHWRTLVSHFQRNAP